MSQPYRILVTGSRADAEPNPALCECGCGEPASLAKKTNRKAGHIKGQPVRFILGHVGRAHRKEPVQCSIEGCDRKAKARGICEGHRKRVAKYGTPGGLLGQQPALERILGAVSEAPAPVSMGSDALPCWLSEPNTKDGRRRVKDGERQAFAYHITYEGLIGPMPSGLVPDHLCRRPACVNPWHLDPVPDRVNVARGDGPTAINGRKEFCRNGHPLSGSNLRIETTGSRRCRTCLRQRTGSASRKAVAS
jgi:hypothetical protein